MQSLQMTLINARPNEDVQMLNLKLSWAHQKETVVYELHARLAQYGLSTGRLIELNSRSIETKRLFQIIAGAFRLSMGHLKARVNLPASGSLHS